VSKERRDERELGRQAAFAASSNALHNCAGGPISFKILEANSTPFGLETVLSRVLNRSKEEVAALDVGSDATDAISAMSISSTTDPEHTVAISDLTDGAYDNAG